MTTEQLIKSLEAFAKWDTISSEFSHELHLCWKAAQEIKRLEAQLDAAENEVLRLEAVRKAKEAALLEMGVDI